MLLYNYLEAVRQVQESSSTEFWEKELAHIVGGKRDKLIPKYGSANDYIRSLLNYSPNRELSEQNLKKALINFVKLYDFEEKFRSENYNSCIKILEIIGDFYSKNLEIILELYSFLSLMIQKNINLYNLEQPKEIIVSTIKIIGETFKEEINIDLIQTYNIKQTYKGVDIKYYIIDKYIVYLESLLRGNDDLIVTSIIYLLKFNPQKSDVYSNIVIRKSKVFEKILNEICTTEKELREYELLIRKILSFSENDPSITEYFFSFTKRMRCIVLIEEETDSTFKFYFKNRQDKEILLISEINVNDILISYYKIFDEAPYNDIESKAEKLREESSGLKVFVDTLK